MNPLTKRFIVAAWLAASLLIVASTTMSWAAQPSAPAKECYEWFARLGFPDVKTAPWAEVRTGGWSQGASGPPTPHTRLGFIIAKQADRFTVLGKDLTMGTYVASSAEKKAHERVAYEERDFKQYAGEQLASLRNPPRDFPHRFGAKLGMKSEVFFLSYACWRRDLPDLAQALFDEAEKVETQRSSGNRGRPLSMREALERELGHQAMWDAVLQFGGGQLGSRDWGGSKPLIPRPELQTNFKRIIRLFPASEHIERAKKTVEILERMVAEDANHRTVSDTELAKLPVADQVVELIFRLRDQNGHQMSQPGWCDVFDRREGGESPAHRLLAIGYPAVPALIEALDDQRFSRSVGFHRDFYFSHSVLTIGDCAQQILNRITGRQFYAPRSTSGYMSRDGAISPTKKAAQDWWRDFQQKGEKQSLSEAIASGQLHPDPLVAKLKEKHPNAVADAVLAGAAKAKAGWILKEFIRHVGEIRSEAATSFLVATLTKAGQVETRVAAAAQLWKQQHAQALPAMLKEWEALPRDKRDGFSDGFESLVDFLCATGEAAAMTALAKDWDKRIAAQRLDIVRKLGDWLKPGRTDHWPSQMKATPPSVGARKEAENLLARTLEDTDAHDGMSGSIGNFAYSDPRICDFALWALHEIEPGKYSFSAKATRRQREIERITAANLWRRANGQPELPLAKITLPVLARDQASRITAIEIQPRGISQNLETEIEKLKGQTFSGATLPGLLVWFVRHPVPGVRGVSVEAIREDDLRGVQLIVKFARGSYLESGTWNTRHSGTIGDKHLGSSSGSSTRDRVQDARSWEDFKGRIDDALKTEAETPFLIKAGISGE